MYPAVDWKGFCRAYGVVVGAVRRNGWMELRCPFCGDSGTKGAVNLRTGAYHCWKCGGHPTGEFVAAAAGVPDEAADVRRTLQPYRLDGAERDPRPARPAPVVRIRVGDRGLEPPGRLVLRGVTRRYLRSRGFDPEYLRTHYNLRDGGPLGPWANRLVIPVCDGDGRVLTWQGRSVDGSPLRYKAAANSEAANIKNLVYNLNHCGASRACVVVEGIFDVWRIGDGAVCTFGISVTDAQIRILADRFDRVWFLFDPGEKAAQKAAAACAGKVRLLGKTAGVLTVDCAPGVDPGEFSAEDVGRIREVVFGPSDGAAARPGPQFLRRKED